MERARNYLLKNNKITNLIKSIQEPIAGRDYKKIKNRNKAEKNILQQNSIASFGQKALLGVSVEKLQKIALKEITKNLGMSNAVIIKLDDNKKKATITHDLGWEKSVKIGKSKISAEKNSFLHFTLQKNEPIIIKDFTKEKRFKVPQFLKKHKIKSGLSVKIISKNKPFGILAVFSNEKNIYTTSDINYLLSITNTLASSIIKSINEKNLQIYSQRLDLAQKSGQIGVFEVDLINNKLWWSDSELKLFNMKKKDFTGNVSDFRKSVHPQDLPKVLSDLENAKKSGNGDFEQEFRLRHQKNEDPKWLAGRGQVIYNKNKKPTHIIGATYDATESKKVENRLQYKAYASKMLSSTLNYNANLKTLAKMSVPTLADWCIIDLVTDDGKIEMFEAVHLKKENVEWAKKFSKKNPPDMENDAGIPQVIKTGKPLFIPKITPEVIKKIGASKREQKIIKKIGIHSIMMIPLRILYKTVGAITLISTNPKREFTKLDLDLSEQLASRASLAIENSKLYETVENERKRLDALLTSVPGIVWETEFSKDEKMKITYVSDYIEKMLGYTALEALSRDFWTDIIHDDDKKRVKEEIINMGKNGGKNTHLKMRLYKKNNETVWVETRSTVVKNPNGTLAGLRGVTTDITENIEAEQRKDNFISLASHELKTPLTSLKVYNHLFTKKVKKYKDEEVNKSLKKSDNQINKLTELINDLLDLSRIQAGKLIYRRQHTDFDSLVKETVDEIQKNSTQRIIVKGDVNKTLEMDRNRIIQVITNFLSNAVKYSPGKEKIIVTKKTKNNSIVFSVKDFGEGIPKKYQEKIFDRFFQVDKEETRKATGLGIGLYICSEIINNHGGEIWVESKKNKGSTFSFSLPITHNGLA